MKILVTGGAGFIGTNLIKQLLENNHEVHSLDDYEIGTKDNHIDGCNYIEGDITQLDFMDGTEFDLVYHLAALSRIQPSFNNPSETFRVNTLGTQKVAEWCRLFDVKMVYSGSSSKHHDPHQSPYAFSKFMGEEICKHYRKVFGTKIEITRFYNVYGPYEIIDGDWAAVIGIWRRQVRDGDKITIVGDGEQRRDFTHVVDIVDGLIKIGLGNAEHEDAWELGSGKNYSINEVYRMFRDKFKVECEYLPDQPGNYRKTLRENNHALSELGWSPKDRLREYINSL